MNMASALIIATVLAGLMAFIWLKRYRPLLPLIMWFIATLALISLVDAVVNAVYNDWLQAGLKLGGMIVFLTTYHIYYYRHFSEQVVLVNEQNQLLGVAPKLATHNKNTPRHRAFSVFLFNNKGELLLQQRALHKKTWPGIWSNSCCGHVMLYQSNLHAAQRRTKYELGISGLTLYEVLPDYKYRAEKDRIVENEFCPVFVGFVDGLSAIDIKFNPKEVSAVKWIPWADFISVAQSPNHNYSPWSVEEAMLLNQNQQFTELYHHI